MKLKEIPRKLLGKNKVEVALSMLVILIVVVFVLLFGSGIYYVTIGESRREEAHERREQIRVEEDMEFASQQLQLTPPPLSDVENGKIAELGINPTSYLSLSEIKTPAVYCLYEAGQLRQLYFSGAPFVDRVHTYGYDIVGRRMAVTAEKLDDQSWYLEDMGVVPYEDGAFNPQARLYAGSCP